MQKRKTAILLALALSLTAVFTACGSSKDGSSQAKPESQADAGDQADATDQAGAGDQADAESGRETDAATETAGSDAQDAQAIADKFHIELKEVGSVRGKDDYKLTHGGLVHVEGENYTFCDLKGNIVDNRPLEDIAYLGWDLYSVTFRDDGEINSTGLVTAEGEVLIPFDAAIVTFPDEQTEDVRPRYILVFTGTEETTNKDEALYYSTDREYAFSPNEEDKFYKGFLRIFDLETREYVNGLEFEKGYHYDFAQVGDNILVKVGDKAVVYSPEGNPVYTEQTSLSYNSSYLLDEIDNKYVIMDADGNQLSASDAYTSVLDYNSDYFLLHNDKTSVINANGKPVLNGEWDTIYVENKDRFRVKNNGDAADSLVIADGSVIASDSGTFGFDPLGFIGYGKSENYTLITPGNRIIKNLEDNSGKLFFTRDDKASYLILNTGEFTSANGCDSRGVLTGVIALENADHKFNLVDAFTGEELIGFKYDGVGYINNDYIYCEDGDDIVIYKVNIVPEY